MSWPALCDNDNCDEDNDAHVCLIMVLNDDNWSGNSKRPEEGLGATKI